MSPFSSSPHESTPQSVAELDRISVVASNDHVCADLEGEAVLLHLGRGVYYGLNSVGTRIWSLIQSPTSAAAILEVLLAEYEVEPGTCEKELIRLLHDLSELGLITMTRLATP